MSTGLIFKRTTYIHVVILAQRLHYNDVLGFSPKLIIRDIYIYTCINIILLWGFLVN